MNKLYTKIVFVLSVILLSSCVKDNSKPGYEFMPNMYRSPSIETYEQHTIENFDGIPVKGSVSRGNLVTFNYENNLDGYLSAGKNSTNPLEKNEQNLEEGKALYGMFCQHCHGATGAGGGSVNHPIYSAVPHYNDSNLLRRCGVPMCELEPGHIYHAITYGLNAMGPHASQITEDERWKIVLYVQEKLQKYGQE
jgi:hypothetical protein